MKNYQKLEILIRERDDKVSQLNKEYAEKFKEFNCDFDIEKIKSLGWVKVGFYPAGNEDIYERRGRRIAVYNGDKTVILIRNENGYPFFIHDYEHLEDYANGIVFTDFNFIF